MIGLETCVQRASKLEPSLIELVKMRASQINGCAYCIDMHSKDARSASVHARAARSRAVKNGSDPNYGGHVPDDIYELAKQSFSDEELVNLTLAVVTINGWNRLAISFQSVPGGLSASDAMNYLLVALPSGP